MADLTYSTSGLFTMFFPETPAGKDAWCEMESQGGTKIFTIHLPQVLQQLRAAGYSVVKAKPSKLTMDEIFTQLDELFA